MIGLVVITHSGLAEEYLRAAEMIIGAIPKAEAISIDRSFDVAGARELLEEVLERIGSDGAGVLIMTDMFGGTPTNIGVEFLEEGKIEILTGVNLPMILKFSSARLTHNLDELAALLKDYGQQNIMRPAELLKGAGDGITPS
ncbi:MAG: PTS system fructose subfamily IIA component [Desulfuromonas sp.]|nr:MAG: PTS system fructose subfamily IIA component [Desulfuromonas sp.]